MDEDTAVVEYLATNTDLKKVADAIRAKGGTTEKLSFPDGFASGIQALAAGGGYFCKQYTALSGMATVTKLGDKYYKIVLDASYVYYGNIGYIMFSAQGTGDGVVVTKNQEILY